MKFRTDVSQTSDTRKSGHRTQARWIRAGAIFAILALVAGSVPYAMATDSTASTSNAAPTISSIKFYTSDPSSGSSSSCAAGDASSFTPNAGSTRDVFVCVDAADDNGWDDICTTGTSREFSVTDSADVSISDATHPKANVALACQTGSGTSVALVGSFAMEYWRPAASGASAYKVSATVTDVESASISSTTTFDYAASTSINVATASMTLGSDLAPGTQGAETSATVHNYGNQAFNVHVSGTALTGGTHSQSIGVSNLKFATTASQDYTTGMTALGASAADTGLTAAVETADGQTDRIIYFQLGVPSGSNQWVPKDTYTGTVTLSTS